MKLNRFCSKFIFRWTKVFRHSLQKSDSPPFRLGMLNFFKKGRHKRLAPWLPIMADTFKYSIKFDNDGNDSRPNGILTLFRPEDIPENLLGLYASSGRLFHYIRLIHQNEKLHKSVSKRIVHKINQGKRELKFENWESREDIAPYKQLIEHLWIEQNIHHGSPCPPISLLIDLMDEGVINILAGFSRDGLVGFITVTRTTHYAHVNWVLINRGIAKNYASVSLWFKAFEYAHKMGCSILSMGSTSSYSLARFKESMGGLRAASYSVLLRDGKVFKVGSTFSYQQALSKSFARLVLKRFMKINALLGHRWYNIISTIIWRYAS